MRDALPQFARLERVLAAKGLVCPPVGSGIRRDLPLGFLGNHWSGRFNSTTGLVADGHGQPGGHAAINQELPQDVAGGAHGDRLTVGRG